MKREVEGIETGPVVAMPRRLLIAKIAADQREQHRVGARRDRAGGVGLERAPDEHCLMGFGEPDAGHPGAALR